MLKIVYIECTSFCWTLWDRTASQPPFNVYVTRFSQQLNINVKLPLSGRNFFLNADAASKEQIQHITFIPKTKIVLHFIRTKYIAYSCPDFFNP